MTSANLARKKPMRVVTLEEHFAIPMVQAGAAAPVGSNEDLPTVIGSVGMNDLLNKSKSAGPDLVRRQPGDLKLVARLWHLHFRLVLSAGLGTGVTLALLALPWHAATRTLVGWDTAIALYLTLTYRHMAHTSTAGIRKMAAMDDEGAIALLVLPTAAALASLAAVLAELGHAPGPYQITLAVGTILLSWALMHSIFALHYAHEFYGEGRDHQIGGLVFPGDEKPDYWDFLYYSLVVAMTAQVSDVQITSKVIRRLTTVHGAVSFFFNATVLALTVNIVTEVVS